MFFENLSWRLRNENNLSDITWALCQSSERFKNLFLTFFFGQDEHNYSQIVDFQREYSRGDSRPDLYFIKNQKEYLIEVKINDRNHHFTQYNESFPDAIKGYITNYKVENRDDYYIRTWEDFVTYLKQNIDDDPIIKGYVTYLENVCNIKPIKKMKLKEITSLYYLINTIDKILEIDNSNIFTTRYTQTDKSWNGRQGRCFQLSYKNRILDDIWGWIGLYYDEQTVFCIEFDNQKGWGQPIYQLLSKLDENKITEGEYFSKPYEEDGAYYFELKQEKLEEFENSINSKRQVQIIDNFFNEIISYIEKATNR